MYSIIGGDGKPYGPVSYSMLQRWKAEGRINDDTLTCREGESEWRPLREVMAQAAIEEVTLPPPPSDILPGIPEQYSEDSYQHDPSTEFKISDQPLRVMDALERGWQVYKAAFWPILGVTLLVYAIMITVNAIPVVNFVGSLLVGNFIGGLYAYMLKHFRGKPVEFADAFCGFSQQFKSLLFAGIWMQLYIFLSVIPGCILFAIGEFTLKMPIVTAAGVALAVLPAMYLSLSYAFTFLLVVDQNLEPKSALAVSRQILGKNWFRMFCLMFLSGLLVMLGLLAFIVGAIFMFPIGFCATVAAYEQLCLTHRKE